MNSLSWMIYAAEVFASAKGALILGSFFLVLCLGIALLVTADACGAEDIKRAKAIRERVARLAWLPPAMIALAVVLPSSGTMYAIAASEMGEDVLNSKTGGKALKALDAWLDKQLGDPA